ncbi:15937_t:CDS:2 [Cetraspora pellucida]|uniref:15937_t:CDS:1 n=1 Tax=Cetraspora pellucida TaxID=1433469 RepID=A0A9N8Z249_9GLOM|nr:15937_t:CDS:2 [Cetraspora pellucida]
MGAHVKQRKQPRLMSEIKSIICPLIKSINFFVSTNNEES